jgi:hypothetical protein
MVVVNATDNNDLTRHLRAFLASHWGIHGGGSAIGVRVGDLQDLLNEMSIIVHARNPREGEREGLREQPTDKVQGVEADDHQRVTATCIHSYCTREATPTTRLNSIRSDNDQTHA